MPRLMRKLVLSVVLFAVSGAAWAADPAVGGGGVGRSIVVAGQMVDVGRPVVLWSDPQGFDGYQTRCIDQTAGGCCHIESQRYGARKGLKERTLEELQKLIFQFVLHFDGCVNSRSCFKSMHNRVRPGGGTGCGLSAHFMIDADGTIYQTMDLVERAYHAEIANTGSVGVEICNRGRVDRSEWPRLPPEYRTRPTRTVVVNGESHEAYDFRPEQYESIVAVTRTLLRLFPRIKPEVPEQNGAVIMDTLPDPLAFSGVIGHYHVERKKWDPGALDWPRLLRALNGFELPVQVRSFTEVPRTQRDLLAARRALFFNAEERATGYFPMAAGRLWHSGVHLRASPGAPVHAPTRGRIVAVRRAVMGASSRSFVLIRHELDVAGDTVVFYSMLAHLDLPLGAADSIPWMQAVVHGHPAQRRGLDAGRVVLLDQRVEAGDTIGFVGAVSRGPEQGPEVHFEIFTAERLGGDFGKVFRYVNAVGDGPIVRRTDLVTAVDTDGNQQVTGTELQRFFRTGDLDRRQSLRRLAVRHRHEWGDRTTEAEFVGLRELAGIPAAQRKALYETAIAPYLFWSDELSQATGLPTNQVVYSYNPLTFLLEIASRDAKIELPLARGRELGEAGLEPRKLASVPVTDWTHPKASPAEPPLFGPPIGLRLGPRRKEDIPLIELAPTDGD
jgi:N-acetylmuramoyl-L-alanine amidase